MIQTTLVEIHHVQDFEEQGFYSHTYLAEDKRLNRIVAVKDILPKNMDTPEKIEEYFVEAYKLSLATHPRILPIYYAGIDQKTGNARIVTQYLKNGTLNSLLNKKIEEGRSLCLDELIRYAHDIIQGMIHLHSMGILHLDLKSSNVFISDDYKMVIGDFGQAKLLKDEVIIQDPGSLYPAIAPPEAAKQRGVDKTADIYQFGLLLYSMACYSEYRKAIDQTFKINTEVLKKLFRDKPSGLEEEKEEFGKNIKAYKAALKSGEFPSRSDYPYFVHHVIRDIIDKCLEHDISKRYTNFYEIQSDLNTLEFPGDVSAYYQDFSTGKIHFLKEQVHSCEITVTPVADKFSLTAKKNNRTCNKDGFSQITNLKIPNKMLKLAGEI